MFLTSCQMFLGQKLLVMKFCSRHPDSKLEELSFMFFGQSGTLSIFQRHRNYLHACFLNCEKCSVNIFFSQSEQENKTASAWNTGNKFSKESNFVFRVSQYDLFQGLLPSHNIAGATTKSTAEIQKQTRAKPSLYKHIQYLFRTIIGEAIL